MCTGAWEGHWETQRELGGGTGSSWGALRAAGSAGSWGGTGSYGGNWEHWGEPCGLSSWALGSTGICSSAGDTGTCSPDTQRILGGVVPGLGCTGSCGSAVSGLLGAVVLHRGLRGSVWFEMGVWLEASLSSPAAQGCERGLGPARGREGDGPAWFCSMKDNAPANRHMRAVGTRDFGRTSSTFLGTHQGLQSKESFLWGVQSSAIPKKG